MAERPARPPRCRGGPESTLKERAERCADLAVRARVHLDLFQEMIRQEGRDEFGDAIASHRDVYRFTRLAHEWAFYVRIVTLLSYKPRTLNLPRLIRDLRESRGADNAAIARGQSVLDGVEDIRKRVKRVRDNAVAHQSSSLSQPGAYADASLKLSELVELSDASLTAAKQMCTLVGARTAAFLDAMPDLLREMLGHLQPPPQ